MMKSHGIILLSLLLSGVAEAATTAPVPTLTLTRRAERRAAPVDRIAMETASREVNGALVEFRRAANDLRISFESSPEYSAAVLAMGEARMKLEAARQQTLGDFRSTSEYLAQSIRIEKLAAPISTLRRERRHVELFALARSLLIERTALSKLEAAAMEQNASITDLRQHYIDAAAMVRALRDNFEQDLRRDPLWQQAKDAFERANRKRVAMR